MEKNMETIRFQMKKLSGTVLVLIVDREILMASISVIGSSCCTIAGVKFWPLLSMAGPLRIALEAL